MDGWMKIAENKDQAVVFLLLFMCWFSVDMGLRKERGHS